MMEPEMRRKAMLASRKSGKGELKRVTIQPSDNGGFIVECSYETKYDYSKMKDSCTSMTSYDETKKVFSDIESLNDFLADLFENSESYSPKKDDEDDEDDG